MCIRARTFPFCINIYINIYIHRYSVGYGDGRGKRSEDGDGGGSSGFGLGSRIRREIALAYHSSIRSFRVPSGYEPHLELSSRSVRLSQASRQEGGVYFFLSTHVSISCARVCLCLSPYTITTCCYHCVRVCVSYRSYNVAKLPKKKKKKQYKH